MNAIKLRNLMLIGIVVVLGLSAAVIYYASDFLKAETLKTTKAKVDAELSAQDIDRLRNLEQVLEANIASRQKAAEIVSESKKYEYQDQIVSDINAYASQAGVTVTGYDFGNATNTTTTENSAIPKIDGIKTLSVTLTLGSPMPFDNYLKFLKAIEQNLTKMQVSGINITPDEEDNNSISNPSVVLLVYVR